MWYITMIAEHTWTSNCTYRYILKKTENIYSQKHMYTNFYASISNSQKVEITQKSISWWMDKQNVV
jgi:hypothetical protein